VESSCERGNEPSGFIKCCESTKWLHNLWPLEWYSSFTELVKSKLQFLYFAAVYYLKI
jgi:hypothetical protein